MENEKNRSKKKGKRWYRVRKKKTTEVYEQREEDTMNGNFHFFFLLHFMEKMVLGDWDVSFKRYFFFIYFSSFWGQGDERRVIFFFFFFGREGDDRE